MEQLDGSCLPGVVLFHLFLRFCARRALKTREGQVIAMRDFSIRKKPYTKPEIQEIGPKDLAALVREKLTKHREVDAKLSHIKGIRPVLFIDDSRNRIGTVETAVALNGARHLREETIGGVTLHHFFRSLVSKSEQVHTNVLVLDLRMKRMKKATFLEGLSARKELQGIPLVVLIQSAADSLAIRGSDLYGNHSFTGPVSAEYFDMALASFLDLWAPF
jgi:hypothetical protein